MDSRRLISFILLSLAMLILWDKYFVEKKNNQNQPQQLTSSVATPEVVSQQFTSVNSNNVNKSLEKFIVVHTDLFEAKISNLGGNLIGLNLEKHNNTKDGYYKLLSNDVDRTFYVQTSLTDQNNVLLPNYNTEYTFDKTNYSFEPGQNELVVTLTNENNNIIVEKSYIFKRNSYLVGINYKISNNSLVTIKNLVANWSIIRDTKEPEGEAKFVRTFTGVGYYTDDSKFKKIKFTDIQKSDFSYPAIANNGWVGYIQHYFSVLWILTSNQYNNICSNGLRCQFNIVPFDNNMISVSLLTTLGEVAPHTSKNLTVPLYSGPQNYKIMNQINTTLDLSKDYGWVSIFATPLFWLLIKIQELVVNWGLAIILLTLLVKMILYPLTKASYISMAKMKALAPKIEQIKLQAKGDNLKLQQEMINLYKSEKVNPLGGCLPMVLQIPVFLGLYWALLSSVELRQAGFLWVRDLSSADPFYILPILLAGTMYLQTFLSPPPSDPVQAKVMKIMPIAFSIMFFSFLQV